MWWWGRWHDHAAARKFEKDIFYGQQCDLLAAETTLNDNGVAMVGYLFDTVSKTILPCHLWSGQLNFSTRSAVNDLARIFSPGWDILDGNTLLYHICFFPMDAAYPIDKLLIHHVTLGHQTIHMFLLVLCQLLEYLIKIPRHSAMSTIIIHPRNPSLPFATRTFRFSRQFPRSQY